MSSDSAGRREGQGRSRTKREGVLSSVWLGDEIRGPGGTADVRPKCRYPDNGPKGIQTASTACGLLCISFRRMPGTAACSRAMRRIAGPDTKKGTTVRTKTRPESGREGNNHKEKGRYLSRTARECDAITAYQAASGSRRGLIVGCGGW
jgi:hypothetical protein